MFSFDEIIINFCVQITASDLVLMMNVFWWRRSKESCFLFVMSWPPAEDYCKDLRMKTNSNYVYLFFFELEKLSYLPGSSWICLSPPWLSNMRCMWYHIRFGPHLTSLVEWNSLSDSCTVFNTFKHLICIYVVTYCNPTLFNHMLVTNQACATMKLGRHVGVL